MGDMVGGEMLTGGDMVGDEMVTGGDFELK